MFLKADTKSKRNLKLVFFVYEAKLPLGLDEISKADYELLKTIDLRNGRDEKFKLNWKNNNVINQKIINKIQPNFVISPPIIHSVFTKINEEDNSLQCEINVQMEGVDIDCISIEELKEIGNGLLNDIIENVKQWIILERYRLIKQGFAQEKFLDFKKLQVKPKHIKMWEQTDITYLPN